MKGKPFQLRFFTFQLIHNIDTNTHDIWQILKYHEAFYESLECDKGDNNVVKVIKFYNSEEFHIFLQAKDKNLPLKLIKLSKEEHLNNL
ncbi:CLUMA_CG008159, isoform A [Clunio marinus]|uniref:CLUMA_CG008159, isoform A n=1 Tax=Clunio marinus TaxID=568069 RepID=A0A1J1I389_9DIPT|nr:CLUMA_CG008159, isoform A [Clunio marinus]